MRLFNFTELDWILKENLKSFYMDKADYFVKDYDELQNGIFETMIAIANYWKEL